METTPNSVEGSDSGSQWQLRDRQNAKPQPTAPKSVNSTARVRKSGAKLRANSEQYEQYKASDRERKKKARQKERARLEQDSEAHQLAKAKKRDEMRKYRQKKAANRQQVQAKPSQALQNIQVLS